VTEGCRAVAFAKAGQNIVREIQIRTFRIHHMDPARACCLTS
jgi:hypothetical protein